MNSAFHLSVILKVSYNKWKWKATLSLVKTNLNVQKNRATLPSLLSVYCILLYNTFPPSSSSFFFFFPFYGRWHWNVEMLSDLIKRWNKWWTFRFESRPQSSRVHVSTANVRYLSNRLCCKAVFAPKWNGFGWHHYCYFRNKFPHLHSKHGAPYALS